MKTEFLPKKHIAKISSTQDFNNTGVCAYRVWYNSDSF